MVYHKGLSCDLYSSASILRSTSAYTSKFCRISYAHHTSYNRKNHCANSKKKKKKKKNATALSWSYFTNHMLINPVKTVNGNYYTTKAPALRLAIEAVTGWSEYWKCNWTLPTRSHSWQQISMASQDRTHMQQYVKKLFLLSQLQHIINIDTRRKKNLLHRSHKTSRRLRVSSVGWLWRTTLKPNSLHRRAGKWYPFWSCLSTEQNMSALEILNLLQQYVCIKFLIIVPQTTRHNSSLVTAPLD